MPDAAATDAAQRRATDTILTHHEDLNFRSQVTPYSQWMAGQKMRTLEGISRQVLHNWTTSKPNTSSIEPPDSYRLTEVPVHSHPAPVSKIDP